MKDALVNAIYFWSKLLKSLPMLVTSNVLSEGIGNTLSFIDVYAC